MQRLLHVTLHFCDDETQKLGFAAKLWHASSQGPPGSGMPPGGRGRGRGQGGWGPPGGEMTFSIPAHKCGLVIGRGGENVKSINQQTGAFVEISRQPPPNGDPNFKLFTIRGSPQQIDHAKQLIEEKIEVHPSDPQSRDAQFKQLSERHDVTSTQFHF